MDLNTFYSRNSLENWKKVLGPSMHYHVGSRSDTDIFDQSIINLYPYIKNNSTILDCGCGWGGPGKLLIRDLNAEVTGVTISEQQSQYIKDFPVYHKDIHFFKPDKKYSYGLFIESLSHFYDPSIVLTNIRKKVDTIIIKDYVTNYDWHNKEWRMYHRSFDSYKKLVEDSGYNIIDIFYDDTIQIYESCKYWWNNLKKINPSEIVGQLKILHNLCKSVLVSGQNTDFIKMLIIIAQ